MTITPRHIWQLILSSAIGLLSVICFQTLAGAVPLIVSGTAGRASQHVSINFKGISRDEALGPMPLNEHRGIHRPVARPADGSLKNSEVFDAPQEQAQALSSTVEASVRLPAPLSSFEALGDNGTVIPPDTDGAVGPNNLMVAVNSQVVIQDRAGNTLSTVAIAGFWSSLGVPDAFDPHVIYDPYGQRWIFSAASGEDSASASILIGVSQDTDPTGGWNLYRVPVDPTGVDWGDYPRSASIRTGSSYRPTSSP